MEEKYKLNKIYNLINSKTEFLIEYYINIKFNKTIIFIHGFNDYHYNNEMSDYFIDNKINVVRLTLRNYGLLSREQPQFYFTELTDYFYEIDKTIEFVNKTFSIVNADNSIYLYGHSTGGLTSIMYCHHGKYKNYIDKLILNSPFVDLYLGNDFKSTLEEYAMKTFISWYGYFFKNTTIIKEDLSAPAWIDIITKNGFTIDPKQIINVGGKWSGQLHSIVYYQKLIQSGYIKLNIPVLVLYSDKTSNDTVLDVNEIKKYTNKLGKNIVEVQLIGAYHNVCSSMKSIRNIAYLQILNFIDNLHS